MRGNPGVIASIAQAITQGRFRRPLRRYGFETYGVTGVALITFILLGVRRCDDSGSTSRLDFCDARNDASFRVPGAYFLEQMA